MAKFSEQKSQILELLKGLTTAENAETIAEGVKALEAMGNDYENAVKDAQEAKSALVKIVSRTPVVAPQTQQDEPTHEDAPKDLDSVIEQSLADVIAKRASK